MRRSRAAAGRRAAYALIALAAAWICYAVLLRNRGDDCRMVWSIGVLEGRDLFKLHKPRGVKNPVLRPQDVTDVKAHFTADSFMLKKGDLWHLFFETYDTELDRGVIAYASSPDALRWTYGRVVLREPFHLSYPYVFEHEGEFYMIPETRKARGIRLYRARAFPEDWELQRELVHGNFADPSIVRFQDRWWLFAVEGRYSLALYWADHLHGPWRPHAKSTFWRNSSNSRPAGRLVVWNGKLVRFAQDASGGYGSRVRAFVIDKLTPVEYEEHEAERRPMLKAGGRGWRSKAMHHIDPWQLPDGSWRAVVDGARCLKEPKTGG